MKNSLKLLIIFGFCMLNTAIFGDVNAQVFSPRAGKSPVNTPQVSNSVSKGETLKSSLQNAASQNELKTPETADSSARVQKNFSAQENKAKYDNSSPKIVSFKVVNGEVVLDENKERSILVYYDNYQVIRGLDEYVRCSLRIYVLNDLTEKISSLGFKLYWPQISTSVQMNQLNPGVSTYKDIMLMGDGCFALEGAPTIEVNRCRVKGMSQDKCADAIKWYEKK